MASKKSGGVRDLPAVVVLLAAAVVLAWPVLTGGYFTYMDNPVHLAEVYALAFEAYNGWSDIAYCGFPASTLHSPLWYGALGLLVRLGLPAGPLYALCLLIGFCAPALALYYVARRQLGVVRSAFLAYLLLVQRPAVVGVGSALGGMWTFYLASAALILVVERLAKPPSGGRDLPVIAALTGLMLLTHLFTVIPLVLLAAAYTWLSVERRRESARKVAARLGAVVVGTTAAAVYWWPKLTAGEHEVIVPQDLSVKMVLARLLLPANMLDLLNDRLPAFSLALVVAAAPMVIMAGLGVLGVAFLRRRRDDAPVYGAVTAAAVLVLLCVIAPEFNVKFLGPVSWRMLYFARVGLCLAAVPFLAWASARVGNKLSRPAAAGLALAAVAAAVWFGAPLRSAVPPAAGAEMSEVKGLWRWLKENRSREWGRVYLQDTFTRPGTGARLEQSHILALTARETGVRQLGAGYGAVPYRTALWTPSEFETLYRRAIVDEDDLDYLKAVLAATNTGHVVVSHRPTAERLLSSGLFEPVFRSGRFQVLGVSGFKANWADAPAPGASVSVTEYSTGRMGLRVDTRHVGGDVLIKSAWHPYWRLRGTTSARIESNDAGLIVLTGLEPGTRDLVLEFVEDKSGLRVSLLGWIVVLALCGLPVRGRLGKRRKNAVEVRGE